MINAVTSNRTRSYSIPNDSWVVLLKKKQSSNIWNDYFKIVHAIESYNIIQTQQTALSNKTVRVIVKKLL